MSGTTILSSDDISALVSERRELLARVAELEAALAKREAVADGCITVPREYAKAMDGLLIASRSSRRALARASQYDAMYDKDYDELSWAIVDVENALAASQQPANK